MASQPNHHDAGDDLGLHQNRRGDVRDRSDRGDVQRAVVSRPGHRSPDQVGRRVALTRTLRIPEAPGRATLAPVRALEGQRVVRAAEVPRRSSEGDAIAGLAKLFQKAQDLLVAALHPIGWAVGAIVEERRGIECV